MWFGQCFPYKSNSVKEAGMTSAFHIVLSSNERYMPGAMVALASVAVNAKPETHLHFHVFTEGVKRETFTFLEQTIHRLHPNCLIEEHLCDESILAGLPMYAGSRMAWIRCFYSRILKNVDWALYLDCDILYLASPEEHFAHADESVYACVTRDMSETAPKEDAEWARRECGVELDAGRYFNSGVMLFNFKKIREDGIPEKIAEFIKAHPKTNYADQTAMNVLFNGKSIKLIPAKFNWLQLYLDNKTLLQRPVIHYVSGIPWLPKLGVVANGRFRLWHKFADKYVWQKDGESCRRSFSRSHLLLKTFLYNMLRLPLLGNCFEKALAAVGKVKNGWRWVQTKNDCSKQVIQEVIDGGHVRECENGIMRKMSEFLRYCVVGGVAFLADFGTLVATQELFLGNYFWGVYVSTVLGFCVGLAVNYVLSLLFVFTQKKDRNKGRSVGAFLVFGIIGLLGLFWTELGMWLGIEFLKWNYMIVKVLVTGAVLVWNYLGRKLLIFNANGDNSK